MMNTSIVMLLSILFNVLTVFGQENTPLCKAGCACKTNKDKELEVRCLDEGLILNIFSNDTWVETTSQMNNVTNQTETIITPYPYKKVWISKKDITSLDFVFPTSTLTYLNLANNGIKNINGGVFQNLEQMEVLILSFNSIQNLSPDALKGIYTEGRYYPLKALKELRMDNNKLSSLDQNLFEHLLDLEILDLSFNTFNEIDEHTVIAISQLENLKVLNLSYTHIKTLPSTFMHTHLKLTHLDLSGNPISAVPKCLEESRSLKILNLNDTDFVNLTTTNGFPVMPTLKVLYMCNLPYLQNITNHSLAGLEDLEELYLCNNMELGHIDELALAKSTNKMEAGSWPLIKKLYINDNKLAHLDRDFIVNWLSLSELNLEGNPWTCECENQWILDDVMTEYIRNNNESARRVRCAAPKEMEGFTLAQLAEEKYEMRCLDMYGAHPETDAILLVSLLTGLLITIPMIIFLLYAYQRNWFGLFDNSPAAFSRQYYRRGGTRDDFL